MNVGLTGGIASGKSTVVQMFADKGALILDFDQIARFVQEPGQPAWSKLVDFFGSIIINDNGTINRTKLGEIVFQDKHKRDKLNNIIHPLIFQEWERLMAQIRDNQDQAIVISDIPLLFEVNAQDKFDLIVLVYASVEQQMERLRKRNGCDIEEARRRIGSQLAIDSKLPRADIVIDNSSSLEETMRRVNEVWKELKSRVSVKDK